VLFFLPPCVLLKGVRRGLREGLSAAPQVRYCVAVSATYGERDPSDLDLWTEINERFIQLYLYPLTVVAGDVFDWLKQLEDVIADAEDAGMEIRDEWPPV
jgi:hypothetical protein